MIAQNMGTKIGLMEHIYFVILGAGCLGRPAPAGSAPDLQKAQPTVLLLAEPGPQPCCIKLGQLLVFSRCTFVRQASAPSLPRPSSFPGWLESKAAPPGSALAQTIPRRRRGRCEPRPGSPPSSPPSATSPPLWLWQAAQLLLQPGG